MQITLEFLASELLYDIQNACYIEGHILPEDAQHNRHMVLDVNEPGNADRVRRVLSLLHSEIIRELMPMTAIQLQQATLDDTEWNPDRYRIELHADDTQLDNTAVHALKHYIHEYLVAGAVADWLGIVLPPAAEKWLIRKQEALEAIRQARLPSSGLLLRPIYPFS